MRRFLSYLTAVVILLTGSSVWADGSVTLTWTPPTQNTDGTPLTDLAGYKIYRGTESGVYNNITTVANPSIASWVTDVLPAGTYYFAATSYNEAGVESVFSNEVTKVVPPDPTTPNPPTNLTVQPDNLTAYYLSQSEDVIRLAPIGTVPEGTACDSTMSVNGHYRVPKAALVKPPTTTVDPPVVFALCGSGS